MKRDTSEYSSSLAPETRKHAEGRDGHVDSRLIPGGEEHASDAPQGVAELDREKVPGGATDTDKDDVTGE